MDSIKENDINIFFPNDNIKDNRITNDINNKLREQIIANIINGRILKDYYKNNKWKIIQTRINEYIINLCKKKKNR